MDNWSNKRALQKRSNCKRNFQGPFLVPRADKVRTKDLLFLAAVDGRLMIEAAWGRVCFLKTLASVQKIALLGFEVMIKATGWADLITTYTKFLMQRIGTLMNHWRDSRARWYERLGKFVAWLHYPTTIRLYLQEEKHTTWLYQTESVTVVN